MSIRIIFLFIMFLPTLSHAQPSKSNILNYLPPIIAAASNSTNDNSYSVGTALSYDLNQININHKFNSWGITQIDSERQEIILKTYEKIGEYDVPALWALAIRTEPNPSGSILANDVEIKLMSNYTYNSELCCTNTLPFSSFDQADTSYIGVSGFINFVSNFKGTFEVGFRKAIDQGNGITLITGEILTVAGCWYIAGEEGGSGCNL